MTWHTFRYTYQLKSLTTTNEQLLSSFTHQAENMKNIFFAPLLFTQFLLAIVVPTIAFGATKSVTINWTMADTTNVTGYKMYYSYSSDMSSQKLACETNDPAATSLTCDNVSITSTPTYFVIAAVSAEGELTSESKSFVSPISTVQNFSLLTM